MRVGGVQQRQRRHALRQRDTTSNEPSLNSSGFIPARALSLSSSRSLSLNLRGRDQTAAVRVGGVQRRQRRHTRCQALLHVLRAL